MAAVTVRIGAALRRYTGGAGHVEVEDGTVADGAGRGAGAEGACVREWRRRALWGRLGDAGQSDR